MSRTSRWVVPAHAIFLLLGTSVAPAQVAHTFLSNLSINGWCGTPAEIVPSSPERIYAIAVHSSGGGSCNTNASGQMSLAADQQFPVSRFRISTLSSGETFDSESFTLFNDTSSPVAITTTATETDCDGTPIGSPQSDVVPVGTHAVPFARAGIKCLSIVFDVPDRVDVALVGFSVGALPVELQSYSVE